jgi:nucleotide-binding universal stress UspA family protein
MFKNVIVGIDRHDGSRDAVVLSTELLAAGGELTFAHVFHDGRPWQPGVSEHEQVVQVQALELLERTAAQAGVEAHLRTRESYSVGRGLHELCELTEADLLVVGSSRHGLVGRVLIGDDTRDALNGAPCAIAIAPAGYAGQPVAMREMGVGYDGSPDSEHALAVARALAAESGATLSAFEAVSYPGTAFLGGPVPVGEAIEQLVDGARERIAALGGVEPHAVYGNPVEELALYSASLDLLVVGSRGYGPIGRLVHGSVSQRLARTARCPLLVLTRTAATRAGA